MEPQYLYSLKSRRYMHKDIYDDYPEGEPKTMYVSDLEGVIEWIPLGNDRIVCRPFMEGCLPPCPP